MKPPESTRAPADCGLDLGDDRDERPSTQGRTGSPTARNGHRARLRARLLADEALAESDLLELALFLALPRRDTRLIAEDLLARFGTLAGVVRAPSASLRAIEGLGDAGIAALRTIDRVSRHLPAPLAYRPLLNNQDRLAEYLSDILPRLGLPARRVLYLDKSNRLLADEAFPEPEGGADTVGGLVAALVARAAPLAATAVILVRGTDGDPTPTEQDIATARGVKRGGAAASILLHDHVIIGGGCRWISLRKLGLL